MNIAAWTRRNVIYPMWIAKDRSPRLRYLHDLEESERFDVARLRDIQIRKLHAMVEHAYLQTSYYRELFDSHGIKPGDIRDERDLKRIPILQKDEVRSRPKAFLARGFENRYLSSFKTGGSTGIPVEILKDAHAVELVNATALRAFRRVGWNMGDAVGMVWGNPPTDLPMKERLRKLLIGPEIYLDTMNLTEESMLAFVRQWNATRPTMLRGHSHSIFIFASFCRSRNITSIRPRAIISSSMMLLPTERTVIEGAFGCPVTDLYGYEEVGLIASECEKHEGMHVDMESNFVELVDPSGRDVPEGEDGAVVVTNLISPAMPLLRYKMGDIASAPRRQCSCGRTLPLMNNISGRVADFLVRHDGSLVAGVSLVERTLTKFPGIAQMQIVQEDLDTIVLRVVKSADYSEKTESALIGEFRDSVGSTNRIVLDYVSAIPQEKSGKYRFAISKVANPFS